MYEFGNPPRDGQPEMWHALSALREDHVRQIKTSVDGSYHRNAAFALMLVADDYYHIEPFKEAI